MTDDHDKPRPEDLPDHPGEPIPVEDLPPSEQPGPVPDHDPKNDVVEE